MTQADEHEALVEALAYQHFLKYEGGSPKWSEKYWRDGKDAAHLGDCPYAEHKGPVTCHRCSVDEHRDFIRDLLAVIAEKAKEWPTEEMIASVLGWADDHPDVRVQDRFTRQEDEKTVRGDYRAMLDASPLVKPEPRNARRSHP